MRVSSSGFTAWSVREERHGRIVRQGTVRKQVGGSELGSTAVGVPLMLTTSGRASRLGMRPASLASHNPESDQEAEHSFAGSGDLDLHPEPCTRALVHGYIGEMEGFTETAMRNRGLNLRSFRDPDLALHWLLGRHDYHEIKGDAGEPAQMITVEIG